MLVFFFICFVTSSLVVGALWGVSGKLPEKVEGFIVAVAGGALIISLVLELIEPASNEASLFWILALILMGAGVFTAIDYLIKQRMKSKGGFGLLAAVTLDGIPENLALGVALIGGGPAQIAALAGSIFLSNLPEAAGSAMEMQKDNYSKKHTMLIWTGTAILLSSSAVAGYLFLQDVDDFYLALIKAFAAGAVAASLSTEVFPQAFKKDSLWTGLAIALGISIAYGLHKLGV